MLLQATSSGLADTATGICRASNAAPQPSLDDAHTSPRRPGQWYPRSDGQTKRHSLAPSSLSRVNASRGRHFCSKAPLVPEMLSLGLRHRTGALSTLLPFSARGFAAWNCRYSVKRHAQDIEHDVSRKWTPLASVSAQAASTTANLGSGWRKEPPPSGDRSRPSPGPHPTLAFVSGVAGVAPGFAIGDNPSGNRAHGLGMHVK